jgi:hypothetical protein
VSPLIATSLTKKKVFYACQYYRQGSSELESKIGQFSEGISAFAKFEPCLKLLLSIHKTIVK